MTLSESNGRPTATDVVLTVTATFTAEPIADTLRFWAAQIGLRNARVRFSPYNQVFQQLVGASDLLTSGTTGVNLILIRLEDWGRDQEEHLREATVRNAVDQFVLAFHAFSSRARRPTVLLLCPPSEQASRTPGFIEVLTSLEAKLRAETAACRGVTLIDAAEVVSLYPVDAVDDPVSDRHGHVPFTPAYWVALGTMLMRRARPLLQPPHKVIAVDADNTLWGGVVGEVGAANLALGGPWNAVQAHLREQRRRGMLLALVSKNTHADVAQVFQRPEMTLTPGDFVSWKTSWEPKSLHLRALAAELGLGLNSFVFLDDNPLECADVAAHCPGVAVVCLPPTAADIPQFLRHVWAFDLPPATSADEARAEQYRQRMERDQLRSQAGSLRDFIDSLDLRIESAPLTADGVDRAAQLTQRTNQFNTSGVRRTVSELESLLASGEKQGLVVRVRDRFGDYGEVGLCVYSGRGGELEIENFLVSCRALGKGVEHRMLAAMGQIAIDQGRDFVVVPFTRSDRNEPAAAFLAAVGDHVRDGDRYRFSALEASEVVFDPERATESSSTKAKPVRDAEIAAVCDFAEIATHLAEVGQIAAAVRSNASIPRGQAGRDFVAPRNDVEATLATIWADVLRLDAVGIHDDFFDLGGDSILSIQIISRASQSGLTYTLREQFELPTIAELARAIVKAPVAAAAEEQPLSGSAPLTPIQRWFFAKDLLDPQHWNMEAVVEAGEAVTSGIVEQALAHVIAYHDGLHLRFPSSFTGERRQTCGAPLPVGLCRYDLSERPPDVQDADMRRLAAALHASLSLEDGPLLRAGWFYFGRSRHARLLIVAHHLVVDGITWRIILEDLATVCQQLILGQPAALQPKSGSYLQWASLLDSYANGESIAREHGYWARASGETIEPLPVDFAEQRLAATEETSRTATVSLESAETRSLLFDIAKAYQTHINDVLLSALALTFHGWTGRSSILIDLEGHGRESLFPGLDVSRTAGWFTSIFPVRLQLEHVADLGRLLKSTKEQLRRIPNRGIGYGLLRYSSRDERIRDALRCAPRAEVMFNYLGQFDQLLPAAGPFTRASITANGLPVRVPWAQRSHLLEVIGRVSGERLHMEWSYSDRLFRPETVERLASDFGDHLRRLIRHCLASGASRFTPSDFPLAKLGQGSIDSVLAHLAKARE